LHGELRCSYCEHALEEYAASRTAARVVRAETVHCPCGLIAIDEDWPTRKLRPELAETVRDEAAF
jgi:hypothetical protein